VISESIILPELLAPAGSSESFAAAISAGADAVYFGGERFSARARAKNLSADEIADCLKECRARGIKAYGAVNTRLRDTELSDAIDSAWEMLSAGTDALIVADLGLAAELRRHFPEVVLHASTQITGSCAEDARALKELGFSRMVCPRELSMDELTSLVKDSPIGIEMFIHGAHCVSVSGQCSMSFVMGGRSGNRGDCAGPCRLPFGAGIGNGSGKRPIGAALSLKDMCLAGHMKSIIASGAESLKIEGRLKGPEYTYGVVSIYRRLLDERRDATPDEIRKLSEYFSRDGFSDGYLRKRYAEMLGTRKDSEIRQDKERFPVPPAKKVPVSGRLRLYCGENIRLTLTSPTGTAEVSGDVLNAAVGNPPTKESLTKSIAKLGQTPFVLESLAIDTDGICGVSASALNSLRRSAADMLLAPPQILKVGSPKSETPDINAPLKSESSALLTSVSQLTSAVSEFFDNVYIPMADFMDSTSLPENVGVSLPDVMYGGQADDVRDVIARAAREGRKIMVHTLGELRLAANAGASTVCSHRFIVYNSGTAEVLRSLGAKVVTISPEVSIRAVKDISRYAPTAAVTGGRMPLMLCRRCPMSDGGKNCPRSRSGGFDGKTKDKVCIGYLTDRTGATLPAVGDRYCMTTVYNSVPTWTDIDVTSTGVSDSVYIFSTESPAECDNAVKMLRRGIRPDEYRKLK